MKFLLENIVGGGMFEVSANKEVGAVSGNIRSACVTTLVYTIVAVLKRMIVYPLILAEKQREKTHMLRTCWINLQKH